MGLFHYFGYGSNINLISLRAKGVQPLHSEKAILHGWKLKFNVEHWFPHEGGMGNVEPGSPSDVVEGMVHLCKEEHLPAMDAVEAYGKGYDRVEVTVKTQQGYLQALTYVGMPEAINNSWLPTHRYLSIIVQGAKEAGLGEKYIQNLQRIPLLREEKFPDFQPRSADSPQIQWDKLADFPTYTALAGHVFDMRGARPKLQSILPLFGGKDMTLFHIKRHHTATGKESLEDYLSGNISEGAKTYLNRYLWAYDEEFDYVGKVIYPKAK
ncbi:gamma-glutamylcyclotransferase family protein [Algoriphagus namhaensis]